MRGYELGIDYGTSNTVAVLRWPDGRLRPLLFDASPLVPSAVFAAPDGRLVVGRDAERSARLDPARFEPNPKRLVAEGEVLLGDVAVPLVDVIAATLRRLVEEATRAAGEAPTATVITYPAAWGALRRSVLAEAAARAGLGAPTLVPEPVAAAAYFTSVLGHRVGTGQVMIVYDLGAGTFDVSAVRRTPDGFEVLAVDGMPDFGGLDLDAIVVRRIGTVIGASAPDVWQRLVTPITSEDQRHFRALWDDARGAKEMLSRQPSAGLHVPLAGRDAMVSREEFEAEAGPALQRTAELTVEVMRQAGVTAETLAGLFLVGGSSRVPMVATTLHRATGVAPTVLEQPEIVVAEGALHATTAGRAAAATASPVSTPPAGQQYPPAVTPPSGQPVPAWPTAGPISLSPAPFPTTPVRTKVPRGPAWPFVLAMLFPPVASYWLLDDTISLLLGRQVFFSWVLGLAPFLLGLVVGVPSVWAVARRRGWRPATGVGFVDQRSWMGALGGVCVGAGIAVLSTAVFLMRQVALTLARGDPFHEEAVNAVGAGGLVLLLLGSILLWRKAKAYPRLGLNDEGITYQPAATGAAVTLPWLELVRAEVRSPYPGFPAVLVAWPVPGSALPTAPHLASLWRPDVGGFVVDNLSRFGVDPGALAESVARHSRAGVQQSV